MRSFVSLHSLSFFASLCIVSATFNQCLYPFESETREVKSLDGLWNFVRGNESDPFEGVRNRWFADDLRTLSHGEPQNRHVIRMPVPASYNDITTDRSLRDHVGTVWYDREFFVPITWTQPAGKRVWLRFGSVHYAAIVWVNGQQVVSHQVGHLPFQADVTAVLQFGRSNRVTVLCDNVLTRSTLPQGSVRDMSR